MSQGWTMQVVSVSLALLRACRREPSVSKQWPFVPASRTQAVLPPAFVPASWTLTARTMSPNKAILL